MKRLATATVVLTALATLAQADGLPKPIRLVERIKMYDNTHSVYGRHSSSRHGNPSPEAEARKDDKSDAGARTAKNVKKDKPAAKAAD
jgi:hypothetical protein